VRMRTFIPVAVIALVCFATPLLAQTQLPAPVQTPAPTQTPAVQAPTAPTPTAQTPAAQTPAVVQTPTGVPATGSLQTPATGSATPMTSTTPQPSPVTDTDHGTAIVLLDRIQKLLDAAAAKGGPITIERGLVDEMRAEVTQVKLSLQGERP
jgi:hypothetical protein